MTLPHDATPPSRRPAGAPPEVQVLMYHAITDGPAPTMIPTSTFAMQMQHLAASGHVVVPLARVAAWLDGTGTLPARAVAITFDDGFADFVDAARVLRQHGFTATVFLPTGRVGGTDEWSPAAWRRPLLDWDQVRALAADGMEFGGHSVTHPRLTDLPPDDVEREVTQSLAHVEAATGIRPAAFAPPFGATSAAVRAVLSRHVRLAVGTRLARVLPTDDRLDIPRIEMHYFRSPERWAAHLAGEGEGYFAVRRAARAVRRLFG